MVATSNQNVHSKNLGAIVRNDHPVKASTKIYGSTAVGEDAGVARPLVAGDTFLGFSLDEVDNSTGAAGDIRVEVEHNLQKLLSVATATAASIGAAVYASDDNTFTLSSGGNSLIGYVRQHVSGTKCWVEIIASRG